MVPLVGPNTGRLFGPVGGKTEQNMQPQQIVVHEHQFGATREALQSDRLLQDGGDRHSHNGGNNRSGQHSGVPPNGRPSHGRHLQNGGTWSI